MSGMISEVIATGLGLPQVVGCPFAFDTPGLADGAPIYTPKIGDVLLACWLEITEAWEADSDAFFDLGGFDPTGHLGNPYHIGWFGNVANALDLSKADTVREDTSPPCTFDNMLLTDGTTITTPTDLSLAHYMFRFSEGGEAVAQIGRALPAKFVSDLPVKVLVTQDGTNQSDPVLNPVAGSAIAYLVVARPIRTEGV